MTFGEIAPGIVLVERFGSIGWDGKCGIWLLYDDSDCIIIEMPRYLKTDPINPWDSIDAYIKEKGLKLRFITASHHHWDHFYHPTYSQFYQKFKMPIIVHQSYFADRSIKSFIAPYQLNAHDTIPPSTIEKSTPIFCFKEKCFECYLGAEPLYLIHSPKHCHTDTMIIFRGTMITSDWHIGPGDPNVNSVRIKESNASIDYLLEFSKKRNYTIHRLFAAHGNHLHFDVDFIKIMEASRVK